MSCDEDDEGGEAGSDSLDDLEDDELREGEKRGGEIS